MSVKTPQSVYAVPTQDMFEQNPDYWTGYVSGQGVATPPPGIFKDYWDTKAEDGSTVKGFKTAVNEILKPAFISGGINNLNVGYNSAVLDSANWQWDNDPDSPHNKVS